MLDREELNVQEIVDIVGGAQSGISRHLSLLKNAGLISDRKQGTWSYYRVVSENNGLKNEILNKVNKELKNDSDFTKDIEKLEYVIEKRRDLTRSFFKESALAYESLTGVYNDERLRLLSLLKLIPENLNVIDLGCGTGKFLPFLASINANIAAVDESEPLLEQAKTLMSDYSNITFYLSDIYNVDIPDNWADACFANMVLHHIPKPKDFFVSIKRVIKPGAYLVLTDFISHEDESMRDNYGDLWLGFESKEITGWAKSSGFENIDNRVIKAKDKDIFILSANKKHL